MGVSVCLLFYILDSGLYSCPFGMLAYGGVIGLLLLLVYLLVDVVLVGLVL